nr:epidermal growth factor receptor substrate 15-like 1 [Ipomoea trifida]
MWREGGLKTRNGFASNSHFGDVSSATSILPKQDSKPLTSSAGSLPASSALVPVSPGSQPNIKPSSINPLEITNSQQFVSHQYQKTQPTMKPNQRIPLQSSTIVHGGSGNYVPVQSQSPWPKMTQADFQKYNKVFVAVDTDKDEKITGLIVCGSLWVSINGRESERGDDINGRERGDGDGGQMPYDF